MANYQTLLFDVDGTLLDFKHAERHGLAAVLARQNIGYTQEIQQTYSAINSALWKRYEQGDMSREEVLSTRFSKLFEALGTTGNAAEAEAEYRRHLSLSHQPVAGAKALLERLYGRFDLYVVTNGVSETQHARLAAAGMAPYFSAVFVSEDTGSQKPDTAFFDYCFRRMGAFRRENTLLIGDSLSADVVGGNRAGIHTCWYNPQKLPNTLQAEVTHEITRLEQLYEILGV